MLLLTLSLVSSLFAQGRGHWERVFAMPHSSPEVIAFADSDRGYLLLDSGLSASYVVRASNGGRIWSTKQQLSPYRALTDGPNSHSYESVGENEFYGFAELNSTFSSHDTGHTWLFTDLFNTSLKNYWFGGGAMFSQGMGVVIFDNDQQRSFSVYFTRDSAQSFTQPEGQPSFPKHAQDAFFYDLKEGWALTLHADSMWHTLDGGKSFLSTGGFDSSEFAFYLVKGWDRDHLYALAYWPEGIRPSYPSTDYMATSDGGNSWYRDSTFRSPRIFRMICAGPSLLWAFVGKNPNLGYQGGPSFADSLYYSIDNGKHWAVDTTFAGDSLIDMSWPDANHGYVLASRDSTTLVYKFVSNNPSLVPEILSSKSLSIHLLHSPVGNALDFEIESEGRARVSVVDLLGRVRKESTLNLVEGQTTALDIGSLPAGYYQLCVNFVDGRQASMSFIKKPE